MAILYGTTADGDSLPVEVNEFGQLIAQGLQGEAGAEGPPGPPGIGQLPPDPFEGAILGWKDNTLSWLGGAIPLPPGTYGPITAYQGGVLTLAGEVDLPYLAQFFLSSKLGSELFWNPSTSLISNVTGDALTLEDDTNLSNFRVGNVVQGNSDWNQSQEWSDTLNASGGINNPQDAFNGDLASGNHAYGGASPGSITWTASPFALSGNLKVYVQGDSRDATKVSVPGKPTQSAGLDGAVVYELDFGTVTDLQSISITTTNHVPSLQGIKIDNVFLVDKSLPDPNGVKITSISTSPARINTDGGKWLGTDGSGVFDGQRNVVGPRIMGQGSVQTAVGDTIVLREDNGGWKIGEYITTTDQAIAARYVVAQQRRSQNTDLRTKNSKN